MAHQHDLFQKFCPAGSDPVEAWALRIMSSNLNTTAKAIGLVLAWHAHMHGTRLDADRVKLHDAVSLDMSRKDHSRRLDNGIRALRLAGFIWIDHKKADPGLPFSDDETFFVIQVNGGRS